MNNMKNKIIIIALLSIFILSFVSSQEISLPIQKQNGEVQIAQSHPNATSINITKICIPNLECNYTITPMLTNNSINYYYNFTQTSNLGKYIVTTCGNGDGYFTCMDYSFIVNGSGQEVTQSQIILIIFSIIILLIASIFFFVLSNVFKHPSVKIAFMALAILTFIVIIGIVAANANVYLAEFPNIVSMYDTYYKLIIYLSGAAGIALIIWLVYYAFVQFNKLKGTLPEGD